MTRRWGAPLLDAVRRALFQNVGLKLVSLTAAVALFSLVHGAEDAQKSVYVDLIAVLPPEDSGRLLISEVPVRVRVTLTGSRSQLNAIRQDQLPPVHVDLREHRGSEYFFADEDLDLPVGVEVVEWAPQSIPLEYAARAERELPIEPRFENDLPEALSFGEVLEVEPRKVRVAGPEQEIEPLRSVPTDPVSLARLGAGEHRVRVRLARPPEHATYLEASAATVRFTLISEQRSLRLEGLSVAAVGVSVRNIRPARVTVRLRGLPADVAGLDPDHIVPYVDASDLPPGTGAAALPVKVRGVPAGVEVVEIQPAEVIVTPGS